jgi:hypothetical protein
MLWRRETIICLLAGGLGIGSVAGASEKPAPVEHHRSTAPSARVSSGGKDKGKGAARLRASEIQRIRSFAKELVGRYPVQQYFFLGLGRGIPISSIQKVAANDGPAGEAAGATLVRVPGMIERAFDATIPRSVLAGARNVVLLEYAPAASRTAVTATKADLERYLEQHGSHAQVSGVVLVDWGNNTSRQLQW